MMTSPDWQTKIANLLAKAYAKGTTLEESKTYEEKAFFLMAKLGIEESELRVKNHSDEKPVSEVFKKFAPYATSKEDLLASIVSCLGGRMVMIPNTPIMEVFAFAGDLERIRTLYFSLLAQMHIEVSSMNVPEGTNKKKYTTSWLKGFVYGASKRLRSAYKKANEQTNALVIYDRDNKVQQMMIEKFGKIRLKQASSINDGQGFNAGVQSGLMADVGQDRLGKTAGQRAIGE